MTNSIGFLCSILLLIISLSYTDSQWDNERWNYERPNDERWNNERPNDERWNNERTDNDRWNNERTDNDRWNNERTDNERWNNERMNNDRWNYERSNGERRNNERSDDNRGNGERRNDENRNNDRRNGDNRNNERRNDENGNNDRRNDNNRNNDRRNDNNRSNERRNDGNGNNDRRIDGNRNNEGRNDGNWNNDRRIDGNRNNERRNDGNSNNERRNDGNSNNERRNDERSGDKCPADMTMDWSYRGNNGVHKWSERYPECRGRAQSPVAINSKEAIFDENMEKLRFENYQNPLERARIENDGHTIQITPRDNVQRTILFGSTTYRLNEVHFHWGEDKSHGSEHTIDNVRYALEMHLVHQSGDRRTAVVAVFFREQSQPNKELQNIIQAFPRLLYRDNSTELKSPVNLNSLLPENPASHYWYEGSLTTPPCTEGVQWLLLTKIMSVGTKQMAEFRKLHSSSKRDSNQNCKLSNNYRPLQSLNGRRVVVSR